MLIPLQMAVSLAIALILDIVITRFARFSRLMIFMPYAIPTVIGALMWGFLYSDNFGPLAEIFEAFGRQAPDFLSSSLIFYGLLNIVTWQWAGYYMIIIYAALQGIDPTLYEAARIDGASQWQIILRIKIPLVTPALLLILVFALIGTLQFFNEPKILPAARRRVRSRTTSRRTCTPISRRSRWRTTTTARRSRSRWARSSSSASTSSCSPPASEGASSHDRHTHRGHGHRPTPGDAFERRRSPRTRGRIPLNIVLALLMVYFLIPFWWLIVNSSKSAAGLFGGGSALWFADDIDYVGNLIDLFTYSGGIYARWLANSALYAIVGGVGATVLAVLAGYGFAKYRFAGRRFGVRDPAGRRHGADDRARDPDLRPVRPGGPDEHDLGGDPPDAAQPVRRLPHERVRARRGARRAAGRRTRGRGGGVPDVLPGRAAAAAARRS